MLMEPAGKCLLFKNDINLRTFKYIRGNVSFSVIKIVLSLYYSNYKTVSPLSSVSCDISSSVFPLLCLVDFILHLGICLSDFRWCSLPLLVHFFCLPLSTSFIVLL
jgi:hypothetical protein